MAAGSILGQVSEPIARKPLSKCLEQVVSPYLLSPGWAWGPFVHLRCWALCWDPMGAP